MTLTSIRWTYNTDSITEHDIIEAAAEIAAELDDTPVTRESIAEICDLPASATCLTQYAVSVIAHRSRS